MAPADRGPVFSQTTTEAVAPVTTEVAAATEEPSSSDVAATNEAAAITGATPGPVIPAELPAATDATKHVSLTPYILIVFLFCGSTVLTWTA